MVLERAFGSKNFAVAGHSNSPALNLLDEPSGHSQGDEARPQVAMTKAASPSGTASDPGVDQTVEIHSLLDHAKEVRANVDRPGEVWTVDEINLRFSPAWNPRIWQKAAVDNVDDLIIDDVGNLSINAHKIPSKKPDGIVRVGVQMDQVHWSPLYLSRQQQSTIRNTIAYLHQNNPNAAIPQQWADVPPNCLAAPPAEQGQSPVLDLSTGIRTPSLTVAPVEALPPASGDPDFAKLLDTSKLRDRIGLAVSSNEGSLTTVTLDDNHAGWSVGVRAWNQHVGELPDLIGAMYKQDPCTFSKDFGPFGSKLINNVNDPTQASVNEAFVRHTDFSRMLGFADRSRQLINHLKDVQKALSDFQDVQVALTRQFVEEGEAMAKKYNFHSELGWAEVSDMINQKGRSGTEELLKALPKMGKESDRIKALEKAAHRPNGQARLANLASRFSADTIADNEP
jgi:hypothetical protein